MAELEQYTIVWGDEDDKQSLTVEATSRAHALQIAAARVGAAGNVDVGRTALIYEQPEKRGSHTYDDPVERPDPVGRY